MTTVSFMHQLLANYVLFLQELESTTADHVLILFRDTVGFKFRGLYSFIPDTNYVSKLHN